jgi:hypothetical protein
MASGGRASIFDKPVHMVDGGKIAKGVAGALTKATEMAKAMKAAPNIIIPSKLTELKKIVQKQKGDYGSRRLERAADEIPNLEKLYQEEALKEAFTGDNAKALMTMNPKDFEKYASTIPDYMESPQAYRGYGSQFLDDSMKDMTLSEYIANLSNVKGGFADVPYLLINKQEQGLPLIPFITGHEGRHRSRALANRGEEGSLVQLLPRSELREPLPRRTQEEYIEALKEELEMTKSKVKPQVYFDNLKQEDIKRPAIDLPDIYAKGGRVQESPKDIERFQKRFAMHKAIGGGVKKMASGGRASIFDASAKRMAKGGSSDEPTTKEIAEALGELAVTQAKEEYESYKKPRAATDIANRGILAPALGAPVDLMNMGLSGMDALTGLMGKPTRLSSEKPFAGSEHIKDLMDKYGITSGEDRPMTETMLSLFSPTGMVKGAMGMTKGAVKAADAMRKPMSGAMRAKAN